MTKGEIESDMATRSGVHFWCGLLLGTMSVGVLGYAIHRYIPYILCSMLPYGYSVLCVLI